MNDADAIQDNMSSLINLIQDAELDNNNFNQQGKFQKKQISAESSPLMIKSDSENQKVLFKTTSLANDQKLSDFSLNQCKTPPKRQIALNQGINNNTNDNIINNQNFINKNNNANKSDIDNNKTSANILAKIDSISARLKQKYNVQIGFSKFQQNLSAQKTTTFQQQDIFANNQFEMNNKTNKKASFQLPRFELNTMTEQEQISVIKERALGKHRINCQKAYIQQQNTIQPMIYDTDFWNARKNAVTPTKVHERLAQAAMEESGLFREFDLENRVRIIKHSILTPQHANVNIQLTNTKEFQDKMIQTATIPQYQFLKNHNNNNLKQGFSIERIDKLQKQQSQSGNRLKQHFQCLKKTFLKQTTNQRPEGPSISQTQNNLKYLQDVYKENFKRIGTQKGQNQTTLQQVQLSEQNIVSIEIEQSPPTQQKSSCKRIEQDDKTIKQLQDYNKLKYKTDVNKLPQTQAAYKSKEQQVVEAEGESLSYSISSLANQANSLKVSSLLQSKLLQQQIQSQNQCQFQYSPIQLQMKLQALANPSTIETQHQKQKQRTLGDILENDAELIRLQSAADDANIQIRKLNKEIRNNIK